MIFQNGLFIWNAVPLSIYVRRIDLTSRITTVPDHDTMGTTSEAFRKVLETYDLEIIMKQDYSASAPDVTLFADHKAGTPRAWQVRADSVAAISTTNPEYQGTGIITEYEAVKGAFGEILGTRIRIMPQGLGLTRDVTP